MTLFLVFFYNIKNCSMSVPKRLSIDKLPKSGIAFAMLCLTGNTWESPKVRLNQSQSSGSIILPAHFSIDMLVDCLVKFVLSCLKARRLFVQMFVGFLNVNFKFRNSLTYSSWPIKGGRKACGDSHGPRTESLSTR